MYFGDSSGQNTVGGAKLLKTFLKGVTAMMRFRANLSVVERFGSNKGAVVNWSVFGKLAKVGPATETAASPANSPLVTEGSVTMTEYINSIPYSFKLETLSELDVKSIFQDILGQNAGESLDAAAQTAFDATNVYAVPAGTNFDDPVNVFITTNSTPAGKNNSPLTKEHVRNIIAYMKMNNYPTKDGMYMCIGTPNSFVALKNQLDTTFQYTESGFGRIVNGYVGKLDNCLFVEQTNVIGTPWANGKSDTAYFFGDQAAIEVVAIPEEIRETVPTDLARSKQIGWYYIGGFSKMRDDRVVKWGSAE